MDDKDRVHPPPASPPQAIGFIEDMETDGIIDNALLADPTHRPVLFGAGGPMYACAPRANFISLTVDIG